MKKILLCAAAVFLVTACGESEAPSEGGDESDVRARREAFSQDCTLKELHDSGVFEESLSEEEYPDVSVERDGRTGEISVSIGASSYSSKDTDEMTVKLVKKSD